MSVVKLDSLAFFKEVLTPYAELNEDLSWRVMVVNSSASTGTTGAVVDAMPYVGGDEAASDGVTDAGDSTFDGGYTISSWQINMDRLASGNAQNLTLYYTTDEKYQGVRYDKQNPTADDDTVGSTTISNTWTELAFDDDGVANFPDEQIVAWAVVGTLSPRSSLEIELSIHQDTPSGDDVLINTASRANFERSAQAERVERSISGRTWLDANDNGRQDDDEAALPGVEVTLQARSADGTWISASDLFGNPCVAKTEQDGSYHFDALAAGEYRVVFADGENVPAFAELTVAKKEAAGVEADKNSKADGVLENDLLVSAYIEVIDLPTLETMVDEQTKEAAVLYQDAGLVLPTPEEPERPSHPDEPTEETIPGTGDPTTPMFLAAFALGGISLAAGVTMAKRRRDR